MKKYRGLLIGAIIVLIIAGGGYFGLNKLSQDGVLNMDDVYATIQKVLPYFIPFAILLVIVIDILVFVRKKDKKIRFLAKFESIIALLVALTLTINVILFGPMANIFNLKYADATSVSKKTLDKSTELVEKIADEGTVLLKNTDGILPLAAKENKLNVFGWASTNPLYGGTGSGNVDTSSSVDLLTGLENAGFEVNADLVDFYKEYSTVRPEVGMWAQDWTLPEPTVDKYDSKLMDGAKDFSDVAMVVISRLGGEGADLPTDMSKVTYDGNKGDFDEGDHYLSLSKTEKDMVKMVTENFDNVIVVVNTANPMELGWLDENDSIKAAIWMAGPGQTGFNSLGKILNGSVNPSGKTVDTYVYDLKTTPTWNNFGDFKYKNEKDYTFVNYSESIYVGYRFYETYYLEDEKGYQEAVQYPFGHGLSYTTFEQKMGAIKKGDDGGISFDVTVKNTGDVAGKDVVEVYYSAPYTNGGIEKSAVDLVSFDKTDIIEPGESETVTIDFNEEDMASYDTAVSGSYILEKGDYEIKIMADSHTTLDKKTYTVDDTVVYDEGNKRATDEVTATNQFADFTEGDVTYLSRKDKFANYEEATAKPTNFDISEEYASQISNDKTYKIPEDKDAKMPTTGANNGVKLNELAGKEYDDPMWDKLLDQLTPKEMNKLIAYGGYQTVPLRSIDKLITYDSDGPAGFSSFFTPERHGAAFPGAVMIAATWNDELALERGQAIGDEASELGIAGWYGPAMNIHRNAFAGRNFEYYSEDGVLSGVMAANEISGAAEKGVYSYMKHFALNDQEVNRTELLLTWSTEQAMRQIYLKPFEMAVKDGGATAVMSSFNYIGTKWAGGSEELLNNVLRDEWGFRGMVLTDYFGGYGYMDADKAIRSGNDIMLSTTGESGASLDDMTSATAVSSMRTASHNILYTVANSNAYYDYEPGWHLLGWMKLVLSVDVAVAIVLIGLQVVAIVLYRRKSKV